MKKVFSFFLILSFIFALSITAYADVTDYIVPITITSVTKNNDGIVQNTFKQGEDVNIEYTITPQDIPLSAISKDSTVDIALVLDTSGSMNDPGQTFSEWVEQNVDYKYGDYYKYQGKWCSIDTLYNLYIYKVPSRLDNAKTAMKSFVEKLSSADNSVYINVSIISFDYYAKEVMDFKNVKSDKTQIFNIIDKIDAEGSTNGGDGLRAAYNKLSNNRPSDTKKYIIYMADGENNILTYTKNQSTSIDSKKYVYVSNFGNDFWNKETIITDKYYEKGLVDFYFVGYEYTDKGIMAKYLNEKDGNVIYYDNVYNTLSRFKYSYSYNSDNNQTMSYYMGSELYNNKLTNIYITDQFENKGTIGQLTPIGYATNVASQLIANANIATYVIGVGDNDSNLQKEQNQNICKAANSTSFISDYYFPVNDTNMLEKLYVNIGEEILKNVPVKDIQLQIQFPSTLQSNNSDSSLINVSSLIVDGKQSDKYVINNSSLFAKISDFNYELDEKNKVYKADPIVVSIKVHIPEKYQTGILVLDNTKLLYNALRTNATVNAASTAINIVENVKPASISSQLDINKDGSAKLVIKPNENCDKIYIKSQDVSKNYVFEINDLKKDKEYTINITKEQMKQFINDTIYVETVKNVGDKSVVGTEEISIISFDKLVNEIINYTSDTTRLSVLQINGQQNLREFNIIVNGMTTDTTAPIYADGVHKKEISVQNGKNDITVSVKNAFDNVTVLHLEADAKAVRPVLTYNISGHDSIQINVNEASNQIKSLIINLYDKYGNIIDKFEETNISSNKKYFIAKFNNLNVEEYVIDIDMVDIYNNGTKAGTKYGSIIQSGMYIKNKDKIYDTIPGMISGYRYQFAIKFYVTQDTKLEINTSDGVKFDLNNCVLYDYKEKTPLTDLSKQFKMEQDGTKAVYEINVNGDGETGKPIPGREYLLVFDIKLYAEKDLDNVVLTMLLGSNINRQIIELKPEPIVD